MEQFWWNSFGGTVFVNNASESSAGFAGTVLVEQFWWNSFAGSARAGFGGTVSVEQFWWDSFGGTVLVEKFWWNNLKHDFIFFGGLVLQVLHAHAFIEIVFI